MQRTTRFPTLIALAATAALGTTSLAAAQDAGDVPSIVVSTAVLGAVVEEVAGEAADVTVLMPGNVDPHAWRPSARDAEQLMEATLVVENGLNLEEGLIDVLEEARAEGVPVFTAADWVTVRMNEDDHGDEHADEHDHGDEHADEHDHGDEAKDEHDHGEHDHGDEAVEGHAGVDVGHACGHFDDEPVEVSTGGSIPDDHTRYVISLEDGAATVILDRDEAGAIALFLGTDVPLALSDAAGVELMAEEAMAVGDECVPVEAVAVFDLMAGAHTLHLGPAEVATIDLVWEEASHEGHGHEGHDHGDEAMAKEEDHDHDHEGEEHEDHGHGDEHTDEHGHDDHAHHDHGPEDPHIWLDPVGMSAIVEGLAVTLGELGIDIDESAAAYVEELATLDAEIAEMVATIPEDQRKLVTGHEVLGYFADRYGFEQIGTVIPGFVTFGETSAQNLGDVVDAMEEAGVSVLFTDMGTHSSVAEAVAAETGAEIVELMPAQLPEGGSYLTFMRELAEAITGGLAE